MSDNDKQIVDSINIDEAISKYKNGENIDETILMIMEIHDKPTRLEIWEKLKVGIGF